ncbi:MAG: STAS domain-containing protein [Gammaproteobacteria bacterium]
MPAEPRPACSLEVEDAGAGTCVLRLSGVLDFASVPPLHTNAADHFRGKSKVIVDLAGVTRSNSAGLALLLEWQHLAQREKCEIRLRNMPAALRNIARVCELEDLLPGTVES